MIWHVSGSKPHHRYPNVWVNTSLMCRSRAYQFLQWVSVHSLQPCYRLKTWSRSTMGRRPPEWSCPCTRSRHRSGAVAKYFRNGIPVVIEELVWLSPNNSEALSREYTSTLVHLNWCTWTRLIFLKCWNNISELPIKFHFWKEPLNFEVWILISLGDNATRKTLKMAFPSI